MDWSLIVDGEPGGIVVSDASGTVRYANRAALLALGAGGRTVVGRRIDELMIQAPSAVSRSRRLPSGERVWYLASQLRTGHDEATFALEMGDALAGTLDVQRLLGRIADLAVPRLGRWTTVTLWENDRVRQRFLGPAGLSDDRSVATRRLDDKERARLQRSMQIEVEEILAVVPDDLMAFGTSRSVAEQLLEEGAVRVLTAALRAYGAPIGTLVVAPAAGAEITASLIGLAGRAAVALSAARVHEERSKLAGALRAALVPAELPRHPGFLVGSSYRPALEATAIGGDFYEMRQEGDRWSFSVGDVCGKGVEAAVLTGQVRQSLNTVSLVAAQPAERLRLLNSALLSTDGSSFVTVVHGVIRLDAGRLEVRLAGGGHPEPLVRRADGSVETVGVAGPIIGMLPDVRFESVELTLHEADTLLCFTDGVPDARGADGLFGVARLAELLGDCAGMGAQATADRVLQCALGHLDGRPHDDMAVLVLQPASAVARAAGAPEPD